MSSIGELLSIAQAHHQAGRWTEAVTSYRSALQLDSSCVSACLGLADALSHLGQKDEEIACYRQAISLAADDPKIHNNLGAALRERGVIEEAAVCFRRAIELLPDYAVAHINLAIVLQDQGLLEEAVACYRRGLVLRPELASAHFNLGVALRAQRKSEEAAASYRQAIELKPDYVDAYINLGAILDEQGRLVEEVELYQRALQFPPPSATLLHNLAATLKDLGKFEEAAAYFLRAIELAPALAAPRSAFAQLRLLQGDFQNSWSEYEWRWQTGELPTRDFLAPRWDGEPLGDKTILLHAEQGLGDTIQFIRYTPLVKALGATVVVECQQPLAKLLANCRGIDRLIAEGMPLPSFDFHIPLLSLPGVLKTTLETIPANVPYVFADKSLIAEWRNRLQGIHGFRVGINWRGRPRTREALCRDIPLDLFVSLAQIAGVQLVSLQKGEGQEERVAARDPLPILDLGEFDTAHGAFMDSAAIMMNLDLVITSDTSIAHLAGALGVPVWVALPFVPNWRWLLSRCDSPWYPTMRLFHQKSLGDWPGVFTEIGAALKQRGAS